MSQNDYTELLGEWQGYDVKHAGPAHSKQGDEELWVELVPDPQARMVCDGCGEVVFEVHDTTERWVKDLPVFERPVRLLVHRRRVKCPWCGPKLERLVWLSRYARVTRRLAQSVAQWCAVAPLKHVARLYGLSWDTVKDLHRAYLEETLPDPDLSDVDTLVLDEFSVRKGHRYATVVLDPQRRQVLWVGAGRAREDLRPFFELLGEEGRQRIKAVAMDMNGAYEEEVKAQCPNAQVVFDLFHVVQKYHKEVVRTVRSQEHKKAKEQDPKSEVYKGATWLLLSNAENLERPERRRLGELLALNERLFTVYVLKDDLKRLWRYTYAGAAQRFFEGWVQRATESGIAALQDFARRLQTHWHGIRSHCRYPLHTSVLEGINNTIKVIKRTAYGYRDLDYFFLRIRAAFPGNTG